MPRSFTRRAILLNTAISALLVSRRSEAATAVRFTFDRPFDGTMAPFFSAAAQGLFRAEGLTVTLDSAAGSPDIIARVASGTSELGLADLNALLRFRDDDAAPPVKAVFIVFDRAPYALIARRSRGIRTLADVEGKTLGVADSDLSYRFWPGLAHLNRIDPARVRIEKIGAAVREPILSAGQVDAITGFSYLSALNLRDRGIPANDLAVLRFADYGCTAYGQAVIVNPAFAERQADAVRGFLRALIAGIRLAHADPARTIDDVVVQIDGASRDLELERLRLVLDDNIVTDDVRARGLGTIDAARFDAARDTLAVGFKFRRPLSVSDVFDDTWLPPADARRIN
ncbi:MAG: ABC transporter substrate-binding protein [Pseudomonadota bacterium]|jgi:NitT/TauT family transport system substrate-binding protein